MGGITAFDQAERRHMLVCYAGIVTMGMGVPLVRKRIQIGIDLGGAGILARRRDGRRTEVAAVMVIVMVTVITGIGARISVC